GTRAITACAAASVALLNSRLASHPAQPGCKKENRPRRRLQSGAPEAMNRHAEPDWHAPCSLRSTERGGYVYAMDTSSRSDDRSRRSAVWRDIDGRRDARGGRLRVLFNAVGARFQRRIRLRHYTRVEQRTEHQSGAEADRIPRDHRARHDPAAVRV